MILRHPITQSLYSAALAVALSCALAACGESGNSSSSPASPSSSTATQETALTAGRLPAPDVPNLDVGIVAVPNEHAVQVAAETGIFKKYGLNLTFHTFAGEAPEVTALLAGSIQVGLDGDAAEELGSLLTSNPIEVVMTVQDNLADDLYTPTSITTASQLKGKTIAISSFGALTYGEALLALKYLGLTQSDVTITQVGDDAARQAALFAGRVSGSINDHAELSLMTGHGMHVLVPLAKLKGYGFPISTVIATKSFIQQHPRTILAIVAAMIQGNHVFLTSASTAVSAAMKFSHIDNKTAEGYVSYDHVGFAPIDGRSSFGDFQAAKALFSRVDPRLAAVNLSNAYTNRFEDQLKALGWYTKMGIPKP